MTDVLRISTTETKQVVDLTDRLARLIRRPTSGKDCARSSSRTPLPR